MLCRRNDKSVHGHQKTWQYFSEKVPKTDILAVANHRRSNSVIQEAQAGEQKLQGGVPGQYGRAKYPGAPAERVPVVETEHHREEPI